MIQLKLVLYKVKMIEDCIRTTLWHNFPSWASATVEKNTMFVKEE